MNERYHDALKLMKQVGDKIHKADYRNWPLFKDFKEQADFQKLFEEIFAEPVDRDTHAEHVTLMPADSYPTNKTSGECAPAGERELRPGVPGLNPKPN